MVWITVLVIKNTLIVESGAAAAPSFSRKWPAGRAMRGLRRGKIRSRTSLEPPSGPVSDRAFGT